MHLSNRWHEIWEHQLDQVIKVTQREGEKHIKCRGDVKNHGDSHGPSETTGKECV